MRIQLPCRDAKKDKSSRIAFSGRQASEANHAKVCQAGPAQHRDRRQRGAGPKLAHRSPLTGLEPRIIGRSARA